MTVRIIAGLVLALAAPSAWAQSGPFVEVSGELSPVSFGERQSTWEVARLAGGVYEEGRYGWVASADRHRRGGLVDWGGHVEGFRRAGAWTISGGVGVANRPEFLYRRSLQAEVARELGAGFVLHAGYRHLLFQETKVHIAQPAVSWYFARGNLHARTFLVRNEATSRRATTGLLRGTLHASSRVSFTAGAAIGQSLFGISPLSTQDDGWMAFGSAQVVVTPHLSLAVGAGGAHEEPFFSQQTLSLRARWTF